jgi:ATP-dependent helicase/nuclease subunit B
VMREPSLLPIGDQLPATQAILQRGIPEKTRWWKLPDGVKLPKRDKESYSSLDKFLYGPYQWVLNYQARIRPGTLAEIDDGNLLKGSLAHQLFERFFGAHQDIGGIDAGNAHVWARKALVSLIEQKGSVLLAPGRTAEMEQFITYVLQALKELILHLQSGDVVKVTMEGSFDGQFIGGALGGMIDLHATNANGETAVVDIKWGGFRYRQDELKESRYLQLAVYAQLSHQQHKKWPALGFFIIQEARLLVLDSDYFPNAVIEKTDNGESMLEFWQRVETTWKWRRDQLSKGMIEVTVSDTEPDNDSNAGEPGLDMPQTFDSFDDYSVLTGWSVKS